LGKPVAGHVSIEQKRGEACHNQGELGPAQLAIKRDKGEPSEARQVLKMKKPIGS